MDSGTISSGLLKMKFMQKTKKRLDEKEKRKQDKELQNNYVGETSNGHRKKIQRKLVFENSCDVLQDLVFGRMSFRGFNPEVEKLMMYYKNIRDGEEPDDFNIKDIPDVEMAELYLLILLHLDSKLSEI
ncbi:unnamed protein product [Dracunculus medinensis]|uniref:Uncharacterized protein n=1 Tax=Dracunculus medinensis TaxID=318479 RepID=A0A0N4UF95_DRAME|nr:unnamed protein product [Dracunculus medinensis]